MSHSTISARKRKLRGLGQSPSALGAAVTRMCSRVGELRPFAHTSASSASHLSAFSRHEHLRPGYRNQKTASIAWPTLRRYPCLDEEIQARFGSRYGCCFLSTHQLASAKCRPTATAALPCPLAAFSRRYSCTVWVSLSLCC